MAFFTSTHFPTQRPDEKVILLLRRHWLILAREVFHLVVMLCIPPLVIAFSFVYGQFVVDATSWLYVVIIEILSLYYLFVFLTFYQDFVDYHLDIWIVTDQRILSVEQHGLFDRVLAEFSISKVQDVTSEVKGKLQTIFDYGNVHVQTAGSQERFIFEQVPNPEEVVKIILQVHDRVVQEMQFVSPQPGQIAYATPPTVPLPIPPAGPSSGYVPGSRF
jgi:membrane protein YdbS with pleckstrin-like domain